MLFFYSNGDGVTYPIQARDQDSDRLLDGDVESDIGSGPETEDKGAGKTTLFIVYLVYGKWWWRCPIQWNSNTAALLSVALLKAVELFTPNKDRRCIKTHPFSLCVT